MLLNDSFRRVPVGAGKSVNRQGVVDSAGDFLFGGVADVAEAARHAETPETG